MRFSYEKSVRLTLMKLTIGVAWGSWDVDRYLPGSLLNLEEIGFSVSLLE